MVSPTTTTTTTRQRTLHSYSKASIQLFPTGYATEDGQPIFMTSSIIRGNVNLKILEPHYCQSLRLIFHASESIPLCVIGTGVIQSKHQQFFGTQKVLLEEQDLYPGQKDLGFAFQLPHVQYPPSMEHGSSRYACRFKLTLYADEDVVATRDVIYRPLIETRLLHTPLVKSFRVAKTNYFAKLHALDYIPGDTIFLELKTHDNQGVPATLLLMQVVQVATVVNQQDNNHITPRVTVVASSSKVEQISSKHPDDYQSVISVQIPSSLPPSFSYGKVITISYRLRLVPNSQKSSLWSAITGAGAPLLDIPVTIGTVSYDMDAPMTSLQVYTVFSNVFQSSGLPSSGSEDSLPPSPSSTYSYPEMPVPISIPLMRSRQQSYDYNDGLPPYTMLKLPDYEEVTCLQEESQFRQRVYRQSQGSDSFNYIS